jgi:hypothetical protein
MVEKIVSGIQGRINSTTACQRERHGDRRFKGACSVFEGGRIYTYAYTEIYNIWWGHIRAIRCAHQFSLEDVRKAREEACIIEETLSDLKAHIHKIEPHVNLLDYKEDREGRGGIHDPVNPCAHGTVRYVRADGTRIAEGTALPFLERLQVEVEFDRDMKRSRRELNIVTDHGSFSITAVQQGARLYVGEHPVVFAPSSPPKR